MIVVGLTGGIGSGKSTVSTALREKGAVVIDADAVTRELQEPGEPILIEIIEHFGEGIITEDGALDRAALAAIVFPDPERLKELNDIVHPAVGRSIRDRMRAHIDSDAVVVLDVPLLIESSRYPVAGIAVVDTPLEVAVDRLVRFRGMDETDARARIARQATRDERLAKADFVIDNSGDIESLRRQLPALWAWMQARDHVAADDVRLTDSVATSPIDNHLA